MKNKSLFFEKITLLITHYNRSLSLQRLLKSLENRHVHFNEIIVSDDASNKEHLKCLNQLKERYGFNLICSDNNRGLGNNINKGQRAVSSPYTLYIQEDFIPTELFAQRLIDGLALLEEYPQIDLVRFYSYHKHPYLKPIKNGFSEMEFHFWLPSYRQFHCYSDHPHLRRSFFPDKFGDYMEGIHSDKTEFKMVISFLKKKGKAIIYDDYQKVFIQQNSPQEPSQVFRKNIKEYLHSRSFFLIKLARFIVSNTKFRLRYIFW